MYVTFQNFRRQLVAIECANIAEANKVLAAMSGGDHNANVTTRRPIKADIRVKGDWWLSKV